MAFILSAHKAHEFISGMALYDCPVHGQPLQLVCKETNIPVSHLMPVGVINVFEIIKIPHDKSGTGNFSVFQQFLCCSAEGTAVVKSCQLVIISLPFQAAPFFYFLCYVKQNACLISFFRIYNLQTKKLLFFIVSDLVECDIFIFQDSRAKHPHDFAKLLRLQIYIILRCFSQAKQLEQAAAAKYAFAFRNIFKYADRNTRCIQDPRNAQCRFCYIRAQIFDRTTKLV